MKPNWAETSHSRFTFYEQMTSAISSTPDEHEASEDFQVSSSWSSGGALLDLFDKVADLKDVCEHFGPRSDIDFTVKDVEGRILHASGEYLRRVGVEHLSDVAGRKESSIFPPFVSNAREKSDQDTWRSPGLLTEYFEPHFTLHEGAVWNRSAKVALFNRYGKVLGTASVRSPGWKQSPVVLARSLPFVVVPPSKQAASAVPRLLEFVMDHWYCNHRVGDLSRTLGLNERSLRRRIRDFFLLRTEQVVGYTRFCVVLRRMMSEDISLKALSKTHGFSSQSTFSQSFKNYLGKSPGWVAFMVKARQKSGNRGNRSEARA